MLFPSNLYDNLLAHKRTPKTFFYKYWQDIRWTKMTEILLIYGFNSLDTLVLDLVVVDHGGGIRDWDSVTVNMQFKLDHIVTCSLPHFRSLLML